MKVNIETYARLQTGVARGPLLALAAGLVVVAAVIVYVLFRPSTPDVAPIPVEPVMPPATAEERGDSAREVIAALKSDPAGVDHAAALERAREFRAAGRMADAQLLYFFAARGKHAPAAAELAAMYDPLHFVNEAGLMDEPDPFQAYKWYRQAQEAGDPLAGERLEALKVWAELAAEEGNAEAERLLLQWE